jgi:exodeoxyribonuclease-3
MKIVSFNTNSIRVRIHQLERLIELHAPDIIGIQETKVSDEDFPVEAIEALGYHVVFHGQKTHYGVALLSKSPPGDVVKGFPGDDETSQRRYISATFKLTSGKKLVVINGYFPQGENRSHATKFPAKQQFYASLLQRLEKQYSPNEALIVMGDMNIAPDDKDIGIGDDNRKRWLREGKCCFLPEEREWMNNLCQWGLFDTFRLLNPEESSLFSWFDYRSKGFDKVPKRGLRIDLLLATQTLVDVCTGSGIEYEIRAMEKSSDHCPVWSQFDVNIA